MNAPDDADLPPAVRTADAEPNEPPWPGADDAPSPIDVATRAFDAGVVIERSPLTLAELDLAGGAARLVVTAATTVLRREPLTDGALGDGCAERRVRGARDAADAGAREAERARAVREAAALKRELEGLDG